MTVIWVTVWIGVAALVVAALVSVGLVLRVTVFAPVLDRALPERACPGTRATLPRRPTGPLDVLARRRLEGVRGGIRRRVGERDVDVLPPERPALRLRREGWVASAG